MSETPQTASVAPRARPRRVARVPRSTVALLCVSILLPLVLFSLAAFQNRRDVDIAAGHRVERTVRVLHEHALKVFDTQQLMIDQLNERLVAFDWDNSSSVDDLRNRLSHLQALLPQVAAIIITDAQGNFRAGSRPGTASLSFADRDYFRALAKADQSVPYISRAVVGRQSGQPVFNIAARLKGPVAGRFYGVIAVAIDQAYLTDFYRDNERDYEHLVVLAREDGSVLASEPSMTLANLPTDCLQRLTSGLRSTGFAMGPTEINGRKLIFGSDKVGVYPVMIGFGISTRSAFAPWWRNMKGYGLVAVLSSLALLGVSGFAIRRIALEGRATIRWRRTASLLESEMAERLKIEEQLRQSQKMEAVGQLTGGIAHDFNNLLTVVIGSLDLLSRRMPDADARQKALVGNAVDGATRAAALTARLLAFSRQHPLDPEPLDASALIAGMSNLLQRTLSETVSIRTTFADDLWSSFADPNQLENAILNLCVNAVDAMPQGGVLTVETANAPLGQDYCARHAGLKPGDYVAVSVSDTGTGMPPDVLARAFEPFFTTKPVGKGTGLGLSQVYGFARQSNGHASIESRLGYGTTIRIFLPRIAASAVSTSTSSRATELMTASPVGGTEILIVEDDNLVRHFSASALRESGYVVIEAGTGPEGLAALRKHPGIALLFTDVVLKGPMNGRELADQVTALRPGLPVLFTTGYTKDAIVHQGRLEEGVNLIGKPFTTAALATKIAAMLPPRPVGDLDGGAALANQETQPLGRHAAE